MKTGYRSCCRDYDADDADDDGDDNGADSDYGPEGRD
jgi:hypothetical protein